MSIQPDQVTVEIKFDRDTLRILSYLKTKTEAPTYSEVIEHAAKLYKQVIEMREEGAEFYVAAKGKPIKAFKLFRGGEDVGG